MGASARAFRKAFCSSDRPEPARRLLARAVAGEAGVPFFSINGSEFVEMFVGVGAARVRDLFAQARANYALHHLHRRTRRARPRSRHFGLSGGHDEKEQTLNQLLSELDGFDPTIGVVLLAATNRPEVLDPALLRAGRFDRQISVDRPDKNGRVAILQVHLKKIKLAADVDPAQIAALTPGFTGADLANLVNEAAMLATRRHAQSVSIDDFTAAIERVIAGPEKRKRLLNPRERRIVAYHEMGHAIVAMALPDIDPIKKVSIIPRGIGALGYTMQMPTEDRYLMTRTELLEPHDRAARRARGGNGGFSARRRRAPPTICNERPKWRAPWSRDTAWSRKSGKRPLSRSARAISICRDLARSNPRRATRPVQKSTTPSAISSSRPSIAQPPYCKPARRAPGLGATAARQGNLRRGRSRADTGRRDGMRRSPCGDDSRRQRGADLNGIVLAPSLTVRRRRSRYRQTHNNANS